MRPLLGALALLAAGAAGVTIADGEVVGSTLCWLGAVCAMVLAVGE